MSRRKKRGAGGSGDEFKPLRIPERISIQISEDMRRLTRALATASGRMPKAAEWMMPLQDQIRQIQDLTAPPPGLAAMLDHQRQVFDNPSFRILANQMQRLAELGRSPALERLSQLTAQIQATGVQEQAIRLAAAIEDLTRPWKVLADLEYEEKDLADHDSGEQGDEYGCSPLTEELEERLATVEFLPIRLIEAARRTPELLQEVGPRHFEEVTAELLNGLGFENVVLTPRSNDGGRDVLAGKTINGIPLMFAFECKRFAASNKVGLSVLRALLGTVHHHYTRAHVGVLVTTSTFTSGARRFILSESKIDGKDFADVVRWISEYSTGRYAT